MTALPDTVAKTQVDNSTDFPTMARQQIEAGLDAINTLIGWATGLFGADGTVETALDTLGLTAGVSISAKTSNFTVGDDENNFLYLVTPASDSVAATLPAASAVPQGYAVRVKNNTDGKKVTVARAGSDTIDGQTSIYVPGRETIELLRVGSTSWIISNRPKHMLGEIVEWATDTLPEGGWAWVNGAAISRSTYSGLFDLWGTFYGVGNGTTTFNVRDDKGRVKAGNDSMGGVTSADRLTSPLNGDTTGAAGGDESVAADLKSHTHGAGSYAAPAHTHTVRGNSLGTSPDPGETRVYVNTNRQSGNFDAAAAALSGGGGAISGTSGSAGDDAGHANVQPTIISNFIVKT